MGVDVATRLAPNCRRDRVGRPLSRWHSELATELAAELRRTPVTDLVCGVGDVHTFCDQCGGGVGSNAYKMGRKRIQFEYLNFDENHTAWNSYAQSKLAQMMCATEEGLGTEKLFGPTERSQTVGPIDECPLEELALNQEAAARLWTLSEKKTLLSWSV